MALKLDNALLDELGLGLLPEAEKQQLLRQIYERLEMNVGMRLADQMSNEQLDEFEKFVDSNDDKGAFQWLETNFPNYKSVVNDEFEKLKAEIRQAAPHMLAVASQSGMANQPIQSGPSGNPGYGQPQPDPHGGQQYGQPQPYAPSQPYGQPMPGQYPGGQPYPGQPQPYSNGQQPYPGQQGGQQYGQPQYYPNPNQPGPAGSSQQPPAVPGQ